MPNTVVKNHFTPIADYPHVRDSGTLRDVFEAVEANRHWSAQFRSVLVLNDRDELVGVLSLRDMLYALLPDYLKKNAPVHRQWIDDDVTPLSLLWQDNFTVHCRQTAATPVRNFITPVQTIIQLDTPLAKAAYLMATSTANLLPVADNGHIVGVLRLVDVVAEISRIILHD